LQRAGKAQKKRNAELMSSPASRIWKEICALDSHHIRAQMIERLSASPEILISLSRVGVYDKMMDWLLAYRRGELREFPFGVDGYHRDTIQHDGARWSPSVSAARPTHTAMIVSPAAKALDYFQECLALLGISEEEQLTYERLKQGYKRSSLRAHPDKGGSKEAFDAVRQAFNYVEKILNRVNPKFTPADAERMTGTVTAERAAAYRAAGAPALTDEPPVTLSAKKLDMTTFNKLFEENRLADPTRDTGYGDWLKSSGGSDEITVDPRLAGKKVTPQTFETIFRERATAQHGSTAIQRRLEPDAIMATGGTELGSDANNFTAAFGSGAQFTDLKEAYTSGATVFQEVADVKVADRKWRSVDHARAERAAEMSRVDPDESSRFAAAAAAVEAREKQRRMRLAQQDTAQESWSEAMRRRLLVNR
jgi:hypothetical protein